MSDDGKPEHFHPGFEFNPDWLNLRQLELSRKDGYDQAVSEICAWLRATPVDEQIGIDGWANHFADAIERGEHKKVRR